MTRPRTPSFLELIARAQPKKAKRQKTSEPQAKKKKKGQRGRRRQERTELDNLPSTDAMRFRLPGSFGSGKRR